MICKLLISFQSTNLANSPQPPKSPWKMDCPRRMGITNMYLSHKYTMLQMMHVSGYKTQKTFMEYLKLSSKRLPTKSRQCRKK